MMRSLTRFQLQFTSWFSMTMFSLLAIALFVRLGWWQIERAHEKQQLLSTHDAFVHQSPLVWSDKTSFKPAAYQSIEVNGVYLESLMLLDNQYYHHQWGYDVLSVLQLSNGQALIVDRGWVAGDKTRVQLPTIQHPNGKVTLQGYAYYPSSKQWVLGEAVEQKGQNTLIIERVDMRMLEQFLHKSLYPFIMRVDSAENDGLIRAWPIVSMSPERHYGYALQWFSFALVMLIIYGGYMIKRKKTGGLHAK